MTQRLKVINLFGAPGMGKSGIRAGLFFLMKALDLSVEEVSEYAKYLVHTGQRWQLREEQLHLLAKQIHGLHLAARNGYRYAVSDSPLQLCAFYAPPEYYPSFAPLVNEADARFENHNFFLTRDLASPQMAFQDTGRVHVREDSLRIDREMRDFLSSRGVPFTVLPVNLQTPWRILDSLLPGVAPIPQFSPQTETSTF